MQVQSQELKLLSEVGLMACVRGDIPAALAIFEAIGHERPQSPMAYIGSAVALLQQGQLQEAIDCLEKGAGQVGPQDQCELHAFLGLTYLLDKRYAQAEKALALAGSVPLGGTLRRAIDGLKLQDGGMPCS